MSEGTISIYKAGGVKVLDEETKSSIWYEAKQLIAGGLFPSKFKTPEQAFAAALYGRELGLTPQRSWKTVHIIQGLPGLEVHQMVTFVREAIPTLEWGIIEHTNEICTIEHGRGNGARTYQTSYTRAMAQAANLLGKDNWKHHLQNMLYARAASNAVKWYYPETQGGLVHSVEELRDIVEETRSRETGAPRSVKAEVVSTDVEAPEVVVVTGEDPASVEAFKLVLENCPDKNQVDLEYGKWRTANAGKPHTLLEGYDAVSAKLFALANPSQQ